MDGFEGRTFSDAVSRRRFLRLLGLGSAGAALAACGKPSKVGMPEYGSDRLPSGDCTWRAAAVRTGSSPSNASRSA